MQEIGDEGAGGEGAGRGGETGLVGEVAGLGVEEDLLGGFTVLFHTMASTVLLSELVRIRN